MVASLPELLDTPAIVVGGAGEVLPAFGKEVVGGTEASFMPITTREGYLYNFVAHFIPRALPDRDLCN